MRKAHLGIALAFCALPGAAGCASTVNGAGTQASCPVADQRHPPNSYMARRDRLRMGTAPVQHPAQLGDPCAA